MAQSGYTPISLYFSATGAAVPTAGNLVAGELALNTNDGKLYFKNSAGVVTLLAGSTSGPAGGSNTQVQYNNAGVLAGITGATTNGTALTLVAPNLGSPNTVGTMPAFTLGGTVSGGGNQINNVVIGTTTPLAGAFTTLSANSETISTQLTLGGVVTSGVATGIALRTGSTKTAWLVGAQYTTNNAFEITPSTAAGNTTFTTPVVTVTSTGLAVTGTLSATGAGSIQGLTVGLGAGAVATNTAVGVSALPVNSTGARVTAIGASAGLTNTASDNTFLGYYSGATITSGTYNTYLGAQSGNGSSNSTGSYNTGVGGLTFLSISSGSYNIAVGYQALYSNTTASNNTAVGYQAGYSNTTGASNTTNGNQAGYAITTGANNSCFGVGAGYGTPVGGTDITTGNSNIFVGGYSYPNGANDSSSIVIGYNSAGKGGSTGFINAGGGGVYQGNNSATWSITSDQRIKKNIVDNNTGLNIINQIQVRNFEYRLPEEITELPQGQAVAKTGVQLGVIAQELQQILPECVKTESTGVMTVDADNLTWYLVNAIKELTARIKQLEGN